MRVPQSAQLYREAVRNPHTALTDQFLCAMSAKPEPPPDSMSAQ
jgi:hypothetical protein